MGKTKGRRAPRGRDTRSAILEGAERTLLEKGLLGASTREIARESGVAEGTLYVHFKDRTELFLALIHEHLPPFVEPLKRLQNRIGKRTVRANLAEVLDSTLTWHDRMAPVFGALSADRSLMSAVRERLKERGEGVHLAVRSVESYLAAEQKLGRVNSKADAKAAAIALFGVSHFWTMAQFSLAQDFGYSREVLIKNAIRSILAGLHVPNGPVRKRARSNGRGV